jgi:hypothetical protein
VGDPGGAAVGGQRTTLDRGRIQREPVGLYHRGHDAIPQCVMMVVHHGICRPRQPVIRFHKGRYGAASSMPSSSALERQNLSLVPFKLLVPWAEDDEAC